MLNRLGNKARIAKDIIPHFPPHDIYLDMFFGAGGIYFKKSLAKYSICNDLDSDVVNLFIVIQERIDDLKCFLHDIPLSDEVYQYFKETYFSDEVKKAGRFLYLSNFGYMGKQDNFHIAFKPTLNTLLKRLNGVSAFSRTKFINCDFRDMLKKVVYHKDGRDNESKSFIYADPPYLSQTHTYQKGFTEQDTQDLFKILVESGIRFAISEFDNPIVLDLANDYGLNVITIGERQNLKNRRTEILITNYKKQQMELFDFSQSLNGA